MARDLDISLLRAFIAVAETGSVTAAARLLNRTQAAVSQQLKRLEEQLGADLFMREHKRITLATAGDQLLAHARDLVALNDRVWQDMTTPTHAGEINLGIPIDIVPTYAPAILRRFAMSYPQVQVRLVTKNSQELIELLDAGELDLTLTTELSPSRDGGEILRRDQLVWVVAVEGDAHLRRPLPLAIGGRTCRFRPVVLDALRSAHIDWRFVLEVSNQEAVNATVAAGLSISALLADSLPPGLRIVDSASDLPPLPEFGINLYLPRAGASDLAGALADEVRRAFAMRFPHRDLPAASLVGSRIATGNDGYGIGV